MWKWSVSLTSTRCWITGRLFPIDKNRSRDRLMETEWWRCKTFQHLTCLTCSWIETFILPSLWIQGLPQLKKIGFFVLQFVFFKKSFFNDRGFICSRITSVRSEDCCIFFCTHSFHIGGIKINLSVTKEVPKLICYLDYIMLYEVIFWIAKMLIVSL